MLPVTLQTTSSSSSPSGTEIPARVKFRIRFRKAGDLRLVSHHDLMHIFERTFRRAELPVPTTQGFNPRPRMWFALSLALGIAGLNEVLELELAEPLSAAEVERRLAAHAPPGLEILTVRSIDVRASARVSRAWLRVIEPVDDGRAPLPEDDLSQRCAAFLSQSDCWIARTRPNPRRINLRPFVSELHARPGALEMALWITPKGAARAEEIITALGLSSWLDDGARIERFELEIIDEQAPGVALSMPAFDNAIAETCESDQGDGPGENHAARRPTSIISNPLSFDS